MDVLWTLAIMSLILLVVVMLWFQYWMGIVGEMQFALLAEKQSDTRSRHFWRFILISVLVFFLASCCEIVVSVFDPHYPVYASPFSIVRVVLVNLFEGLCFGFFMWMYAVIGVSNGAFWPLSEDEKQAGKKFFWKARRYTQLCLDEKLYLGRLASFRGLLFSLIRGYLSLFLGLVVFLLFGGLSMAAMHYGFPPVSEAKPHVSPTGHGADGAWILGVFFLLATALGFLPWLVAKIRAWRFLGKDLGNTGA